MRVAVLGQGSAGRRHAQLALQLGHELTVYDPNPAASAPVGAERAGSVEECLQGAQAAVIASPSSAHAAQARAAIEHGVATLVEKPLALDAARAAELEWLAHERGTLLSVAMNLREHPGVLRLQETLAAGAIGEILLARARCGSWLPGWRAGDYRDSYSARRELGGGVLLDVAVHELDYLLLLAGPARSVTAVTSHVSPLQGDVEDVALLALELADGGVAELSVDYFDRAYTRGCRIAGTHGTLDWSWEEQSLTHHRADGTARREPIASDVAATYRAQLERFLSAAQQAEPPPVPAAQARDVLAVIDAARVSAREGRRIGVAPPVRLRDVGARDAQLLLAWRNDPQTRRWSREQSEIAPAAHDAWLAAALADPGVWLWIAELAGRSVGCVRVGPLVEGHAEIHVSLDADERGLGLGTAVLQQGAAQALTAPGLHTLHAHVKPENGASLTVFARAGFEPVRVDEEGLVRLERTRVEPRIGALR